MTDKEFKHFLRLLKQVKKISDRYDMPENHLNDIHRVYIHEDVYNKICDFLDVDYIELFGIT